MSESWEEALNAFEARLALCGVPELIDAPAPWEPPPTGGPIPAALVPRAQALLARAEAVQVDLAAQREQVREELASLPRRVPAAEAEARFVAHA